MIINMKTTYILFFLLCYTFALSQFHEDFDNPNNELPVGWIAYKGNNNAGSAANKWKIIDLTKNSPDKCAFVRYENSGKTNENWLVTPKIDLTHFRNNYISFLQHNSFVGHKTKYEIKVSKTSATDRKSFVTVESYDNTTLDNQFSSKKINISSYDGKEIYIAFVKIEDDGDNWYIDNVNVKGIFNNDITPESKIHFFPNPTDGKLYSQENHIKTVHVIDMSQNLLMTFNDQNTLDISKLPAGIYFLKIVFETGEIQSQKIIKITSN